MTKMFAAFVAAVLLTACGGSPVGPSPSPSPTPAPAPVVLLTKTFTIQAPDKYGHYAQVNLYNVGPGKLEARYDWSNPNNTIWALFFDSANPACQTQLTFDQVWNQGVCTLGTRAMAGSDKPRVIAVTLEKEYEAVGVKFYSPPENVGAESCSVQVLKF